MRKRIIKKIKLAKNLKVYPVPPPEALAMYPAYAIVKYRPESVIEKNGLVEDGPWFVPIVLSSTALRAVYWLSVTEFRVDGRMWESMCEPCDKRLQCASEAQHINPKFNCFTTRTMLVEIRRRPRAPAEVAAPNP